MTAAAAVGTVLIGSAACGRASDPQLIRSSGPLHVTPLDDIPTTTTTVAPAPSPNRPAERSVSPAPGRPRRTPARAGGSCSLDYIRAHENGGDYGRSTNPGHFGAFQFDHQTWAANGGDPSHWGTASPAEQEAVAATTYARRGSQPWAVCG